MANFPAAVPALPNLPSYSQQDILDLFDRILPKHYLDPLKDPGPGYEYLQAVAKVIERVSEAIAHVGSGCYIGSATGGSYSYVTVELYRDTAVFGKVTLLGMQSAPQGTLVGTAEGYTYQLVDDAPFDVDDLGPKIVTARSTVRSWLHNRPGPYTPPGEAEIPGPINRLIKPVVAIPSPPAQPNFDPTIKVRQISPATDGSAAMLDAVGYDRGISRNFSGITTVTFTYVGFGTCTILPGTVVSTVNGFHYQVTEAAYLTPSNSIATVAVSPLFLNVPANTLSITEIVTLVGSSGLGVLSVSSSTPTTESDVDYRTRLIQLPNTLTPNAIRTALAQLLGAIMVQYSKTYAYREAWDVRLQMAYDAEYSIGTVDTLTTANINVPCPAFNGAVFVYDYINPDALTNRYLVDNPARGFVVVRLPTLPSEGAQGATYPQVVESLEQIKPAGVTMLYILAD